MKTEQNKFNQDKPKFIQFAIVCEIEGNVNADESVGTRTTIKKFITREGIYPYVSSRAIKKGIKNALVKEGYSIDPFERLIRDTAADSGNFIKYIDQDLFGFMVPVENGVKRKAPVEISYLVSFYPIPITTEFAGRFSRKHNPVPYEIEQAKFVGRFYGIIYNYIGVFHESEVISDEYIKDDLEKAEKNGKIIKEDKFYYLEPEERKNRLRALLKILLTGSFTLPRSTNQLNQGNYKYVIVALTKSIKPLPAFVNIKHEKEREYEIIREEKDGKIIEKVIERFNEGYTLDIEKIKELAKMLDDEEVIYIIDYVGDIKEDYFKDVKNTTQSDKVKVKVVKPSNITNMLDEIIGNREKKIDGKIDLMNLDYYKKFYEFDKE
ncbi:MAG: type I-B CRISPR-associated protein Cas7/Cst2/DevR [Candidatus Aenigmatarchaeota archaeon]